MEVRKTIPYFIIILFCVSCMKEEIPIAKHELGDVEIAQVNMGKNYTNQIYFDLETNLNVAENLKTEWDLGFECTKEGWHVILNSSKLMRVAKTNESDFSKVMDTLNRNSWDFDARSGNLDSTAIADWRKDKFLYIIDRGSNEKGKHQGFFKILLSNVNDDAFEISISSLEQTVGISMIVPKNGNLNFISLSLDNGGEIKSLEPNNGDWDLLFSHYTYYFEVEATPYLVAGALLNRYETTAYTDSLHSYEDINLEMVQSTSLSRSIDRPGYDWKTYNFDEAYYEIHSDKIYIIQTQEGFYYKLRFVDFYNDAAQSGFPKFEYQRL